MHWLSLAADGLWIVALAIMATTTRTAWRRMRPETRVPMQFGRDGQASWRLTRDMALTLPVALALLFGMVLLWGHRSVTDLSYDVIFFGLRATLAAMLTLMHMQWLRAALAILEAEGELDR
jgi:hypothetical protein